MSWIGAQGMDSHCIGQSVLLHTNHNSIKPIENKEIWKVAQIRLNGRMKMVVLYLVGGGRCG
jgi:hypothetical protein